MGYFSPRQIITKLVYLAAWLMMKPRGNFKLLTREIFDDGHAPEIKLARELIAARMEPLTAAAHKLVKQN